MQIDMQDILLKTIHMTTRPEEFELLIKSCYMTTFDPEDLIGRALLLPPEETGERHRAKVTMKVVEITEQDDTQTRDDENPSGSKPMPTFDPENLIGRIFLLPPEDNGERHRAKVARKVVSKMIPIK